MDVTLLQTLIGSLGFPIVACGGLFWYVQKRDKEFNTNIERLSSSLDKNTEVLHSLLTKLGGD